MKVPPLSLEMEGKAGKHPRLLELGKREKVKKLLQGPGKMQGNAGILTRTQMQIVQKDLSVIF